MRKALLGTTALFAASLAIGDAYAADGVKLAIGGRYMGAAGVVIDEDFDVQSIENNLRAYVFKQDVEVYFSGETVLDNGLTVGARVELEGQTSGDQIDAVYAYFSGGFGELRFGDTGEAMTQFCMVVPTASGMFGADTPNFSFTNAGAHGQGVATNGTCAGVDSNSTKVIYFSPNFGGFSFAASFTPDNTEDTRNTVSGAATRFDNNVGQNSENLSVAAQFTHDFNGINLAVGGGGTWSFDREGVNDPDERHDYNAYAQVGFSGFTVGGAMGIRQNKGDGGEDDLVWGGGVTYNMDAWTIGLGYTHGVYEVNGPLGGVAPTPDVVDYSNTIALTASYALGPGIQIDAVAEYNDYQSDAEGASPDRNYEGFAIGIGTLIQF
jgi:predicted porin